VATKHGFRVWIVESGLSESDACEIERQVIESYAANGVRLTNMTPGGEGTKYLSDDAKERKRIGISKAKAGKPISDALRAAISRAHKGRVFSEDHLRKLSEAGKRGRSALQLESARRSGMLCAKQVKCVETGEIHLSINSAARWVAENGAPKASKTPIRLACKNPARAAYGFHWTFVEKSPD
jgi:hypothetical protein